MWTTGRPLKPNFRLNSGTESKKEMMLAILILTHITTNSAHFEAVYRQNTRLNTQNEELHLKTKSKAWHVN